MVFCCSYCFCVLFFVVDEGLGGQVFEFVDGIDQVGVQVVFVMLFDFFVGGFVFEGDGVVRCFDVQIGFGMQLGVVIGQFEKTVGIQLQVDLVWL